MNSFLAKLWYFLCGSWAGKWWFKQPFFFSQFFSDFFTQPLNNLWIKTNGYILPNHYIFNYLSIFYAFFFKYNQQPFFLCGSRAGRWWFKQPIWNNGMVSKHRFSHCLPQLAATDVFKVLFLSLRTSIFYCIYNSTVERPFTDLK